MTYEEAMDFISSSNQYGSRPGLTAVTELLRRIGDPQERLKLIHVAGTNGKGSTTAYIASILASEGYRVGRYISPAVFSYNEKIQITRKNGDELQTTYISEKGITEAVAVIKPACEGMVQEGLDHPTTFEIETAMAFLYLMKERVDFAVIEVGMGGRLDATNVIRQPLCSVITSISMDHMQYLGDTLGKITKEKAGIIKSGVPVVTSNSEPEVLKVLEEFCNGQGAQLTLASLKDVKDVRFTQEQTDFTYLGENYCIKLLGEYQISNAILAVEAALNLRALGYSISNAAIRNGLLLTKWTGRLEVLSHNPLFIIDGAHNEDAAIQLKKTIDVYFRGRRLIFIMGILADKDYKRILQLLAPLSAVLITITPPSNRALASAALAAEAKNYCNGCIIDAETITKAVRTAYDNAVKEDVIIAFGSLTFLREVKNYLASLAEGSKILACAIPSASTI